MQSLPSLSSFTPYQVLARKYRLKTFEDMIGQDSLVRILTNGLKAGTLPHALIFTGIRGVGKTTTARILARALNCIGPEGTSGPTPLPCGVCQHCQDIEHDRHIDVIEMDAASRTGVEDIREVIEAARYKAISARYKIYIIDEVHMLSKNAFNALLKTLEEPPLHVKFIFATTEIRRVPDTVLSRCMRFDLARVPLEKLQEYLKNILSKEKYTADEGALFLISQAAEGSVRDSLSLLDQALNLNPNHIKEEEVRRMLHLSEVPKVLKLFETLMTGETKRALDFYQELYDEGAEVSSLLSQLLEKTTTLSTLKVSPDAFKVSSLSETLQQQMKELSAKLSMPVLIRFWQVLLKGIQEVQLAPSAFQAGQMILIRLSYLSALPTPQTVIEKLKLSQQEEEPIKKPEAVVKAFTTIPSAEISLSLSNNFSDEPQSFKDLVELAGKKREPLFQALLMEKVHLIHYEIGCIELRLALGTPKDFISQLKQKLLQWTEREWTIQVKEVGGSLTLLQEKLEKEKKAYEELTSQSIVQKALEMFPGSQIHPFISQNN